MSASNWKLGYRTGFYATRIFLSGVLGLKKAEVSVPHDPVFWVEIGPHGHFSGKEEFSDHRMMLKGAGALGLKVADTRSV